MKDEMNCQLFGALLNDYLDNELDMAAKMAFLEHARQCPQCEKTLQAAKTIMNGCAALDEETYIPIDAQAAWRKAIRQEAEGKTRSKARPGAWMRRLGTVAAAVVLFVGGAIAVQNIGSLSSVVPNLMVNNNVEYEAAEDYDAYYDESYSTGAMDQSARTTGLTEGGMGYAKTGGLSTDVMPLVWDTDGGLVEETPAPDEMAAVDRVPADPNGQIPTPTSTPVDADIEVETMPTSAPAGVDPEVKKADIVVIRSASRSLESINFDADYRNIEDLVSEYEGIMESKSSYGTAPEPGKTRGRNAYFYVRIPTADLDDFLKSLDAIGTTMSRGENSQDISMQYYDVKTRLDNQKAFRTKLQQMVGQATTIEEMIAIEEKLSGVQADIDSMEGTIRGWDSQVNYSGVNIDMTEVADRKAVVKVDSASLMDRIRTGFYDAINNFMTFVQNAAVWLVTIWPWLVLLIVVLIIGVPIVRRRRRR